MRYSSSSPEAEQRGEFLLSLPFVLIRPSRYPPILGRAIYFTESTDSNANLIHKHPHRHTQI